MKFRFLVVLLFIYTSFIMIYALQYEPFHEAEEGLKVISHIPLKLGNWDGFDSPLEKQVYDILETKSIIHRSYTSVTGERSVFLSIVYYPETKVAFHSPEACLGSRGMEIQKFPKDIDLPVNHQTIRLKLNQLIQKDGAEKTLVYYFYKAGSFLGRSYVGLRFNLAVNRMGHAKRSGSLIRVSTTIGKGGIGRAEKILKDYLSDLLPYVERYL